MKLIFLLLTGLFNQDTFLVKQDDVFVDLSELDAFVFSMSDKERIQFSDNKQHIENTILTLLNINIVYQYITNSELDDLELFQQIKNQDFQVKSDDSVSKFSNALSLTSEQVTESYKTYKIENEYYRTLLSYINSQADEKLIPLAKEHYLINKKDYVIAEKRDLSVIVLNNDAAAQISHISLMNELKETTIENFHHKATELSVDLSKDSNQGNWGDYRKSDFNYAFKETVFAANVGVIPQLFEEGNKAYIVRVNCIKPEKVLVFDEVKEKIIYKLKGKTVNQEFQNIINQKGNYKVEVNAELVAHVFERYKVFNEE